MNTSGAIRCAARLLLVLLFSLTCACGSDEAAPSGSPAPGDIGPRDAGSDASAPIDGAQSTDASTRDSGRDAGGSDDAAGDASIRAWEAPDVCSPLTEKTPANSADRVLGEEGGGCRAENLRRAAEQGGVIGFECGADATISLEAPLIVSRDLTLIGGGDLKLRASGEHRLIHLMGRSTDQTPHLKLQGVELVGGRAPGIESNPELEDYAGFGGAILNLSGRLTAVNTVFRNNRGSNRGPSVAGGAIYSESAESTIIDGSYLSENAASNGGAIGQRDSPLLIADTVLSGNQATGTGGYEGGGGAGGAIHVRGVGHKLTLCGTILEHNSATAFGGALYSFATEGVPDTIIRRSSIRNNEVFETDPSLGGGIYLAATSAAISRTTIAGNVAGGAGGLYIGIRSRLTMVNSTIADNRAARGLGGGLSVSPETSGTLRQVTIAGNRADHSTGFAAGIHNGGGLTLENSLIADQSAGNSYSPLSCQPSLNGGAGSIQFPKMRPNGKSDPRCAPDITFADPMLGPLTNRPGTVGQVLIPSSQSPAVGFAADCPDVDQLGRTRSTTCTAGAVEVRR